MTIVDEEDTYEKPAHGWTCFHCGETFTTFGGARDHFGENPERQPGCLIDRVAVEDGGTPERGRGLLMALRKSEDEADSLRAELFQYYEDDGPKDREIAAMRFSIAEKVRRAEEDGYAKALRDILAGKVEREHAVRIVEALTPLVEGAYV